MLSEAARAADLSNERGVFGKMRLLRNVMGLWLVQQCRAAWDDATSPPSYDELVRLAASAEEEPACSIRTTRLSPIRATCPPGSRP